MYTVHVHVLETPKVETHCMTHEIQLSVQALESLKQIIIFNNIFN